MTSSSYHDAESIKPFLKTALDLELDIFETDQAIRSITNSLNEINQARYEVPEPELAVAKPEDFVHHEQTVSTWSERGYLVAAVIVSAIVGIVVGFYIDGMTLGDAWAREGLLGVLVWPLAMAIYAILSAAIGGIVGAISMSVIISLHDAPILSADRAAYEKELETAKRICAHRNQQLEEEYSEALESYNRELARFQSQKSTVANQLNMQRESLSKLVRVSREMLDEHYTNGPVHFEYRNLAAISELYKYFDRGMCTTLGEAYREYEHEVRYNNIITKLDDILESIDTLRTGQAFLYQQLQVVNGRLGMLNESVTDLTTSVTRLQDDLSDVKTVQRMNAYTTQRIASVTTSLNDLAIRESNPYRCQSFKAELQSISDKLSQ